MKPRPLQDQVWKHGSVHYKIVKILASGSIEAHVRNGNRGRWASKLTTLTSGEMNYLEFVKGPGFIKKKKGDKNDTPEIPKTSFKLAIKKSKRYVVTYAQNATPVNPDFLKSLLTYCKENSAELVIIPGRYRNATSIWSRNNKHDEWWDESTHPYLISKRICLAPGLTVYGDISIQPTATRPLTGMEVFTGKSSAIFGHPKMQLLTVATNSRRPKMMTTTGCVTVQNYTNSKAGKKGEAHHIFGAIVVETNRSGGFHIRQINAKSEDGSFIDLEWEYAGESKKAAPPAEALVLGDVHAESVEEIALAASFEMIKALKCKRAIYHDVLDFNVRNHHSIDDFCNRYYRATSTGNDSVEAELVSTIDILESTPKCAQPIVIQSNHDEAFDRWMDTINPKNDPVNALLFHKMWVAKLEEFEQTGSWRTAFNLYYDLNGHSRAKFINRKDDYTILDIVCGYHGDKGTNGSRGSSASYAKLGVKTVVGHRHTPSIMDGCYTVGVIGKLDQGYNDLPSSWAHANCAIYANGKRSLIFIHPNSGEWRS
tara:strand:- start:10494 stop:12113 length:1620 start_codon:yes stop_codon:yes gene_type:complete